MSKKFYIATDHAGYAVKAYIKEVVTDLGIRAALCHDHYTAKLTRQHNDANILCFGERVVGKGVIEDMIETFANTEFEGGRHAGRVAKIEEGCTFGADLG